MKKLPIKKGNLIIRSIEEKDINKAKIFQEFINALVKENAQILLKKKKTLEEEKKWLKGQIKSTKKNKKVHLIGEDLKENKIAASGGIELMEGRRDHVGEFGISITKKYRGKGLGTFLTELLIKKAKEKLDPPPKMIRLSVYKTNKPAIHLYKKVGFKEVARIPKQVQHNNKLIDEIIMLLKL